MLPLCVAAEHYVWKHLDTRVGLASSYVKTMAEDGQGFVWIGTEEGLHRWDGYSLLTFNTQNSDISSNEINTLLYIPETDQMYIGTAQDNINVLDLRTRQFHNFQGDDRILSPGIVHLSRAADGGIWITAYSYGVQHYDFVNDEFKNYDSRELEGLYEPNWVVADDGNGSLYVGHVKDGMSIINLRTNTVRNFKHSDADPTSIPSNSVNDICIDKYGHVWVGTNAGLALYNPHRETFDCVIQSQTITRIIQSSDGQLYVGTSLSGVKILTPPEWKLSASSPNQYSSPNIAAMMEDHNNNVWIGHNTAGIDIKIRATRVVRQTHIQNFGIATTPSGQFIVLQAQKIIVGNRAIDLPLDLSTTGVNALYCDRDNNLWIQPANSPLIKINLTTGKCDYIHWRGNVVIHIFSFYQDTNGDMLLSTTEGLYTIKRGSTTFIPQTIINEQLPSLIVSYTLRDNQGKLWVSTFREGIHVFSRQGELLCTINHSKGFCDNVARRLLLDSKGGVWAATRSGLGYFPDTQTPEQFQCFGAEAGLDNVHLYSIAEDQKGNIWMRTGRGISALASPTPSAFSLNNSRFYNYPDSDGIQPEELKPNISLMMGDTMYFASPSKIMKFAPNEMVRRVPNIPLQISNVILFTDSTTVDYTAASSLEFEYDQNTIRVDFAVPNIAYTNQVEYSYMLEGLDNTWRATQGDNYVTLRSLPHGKYIFRVRARLRNGEWGDSQQLGITILPPLWLAWYSKLFYVICIALILWYIVRVYKKRLRLRSELQLAIQERQQQAILNEERLHFLTNITHELRTPLTLLLAPLEDLADSVRDTQHIKQVNLIKKSAQRLLALIGQILELGKSVTHNRTIAMQEGDISTLVKDIFTSYKDANRNPDVEYLYIESCACNTHRFDSEVITIILNNLLSNAVKYTPKGSITCQLEATDDKVMITIKDTGYGIGEEHLPHIFERYYQARGKHQASGTGIGLALVHSLCQLHNIDIQVSSTLGTGTTFRLCIPSHAEEVVIGDTEQSRDCILVVEDDADIRDYIATIFADNYEVLTATNGKNGWLLAQERIPTVIISDIMMPEMDGIELCRLVKGNIATSHIPVILLTAKDTNKDKEEGYTSGADSYITKPFTSKLIKARVSNLLQARQQIVDNAVGTTSQSEARNELNSMVSSELTISRFDQEFLLRLKELVEQNITGDSRIEMLAANMNMSYSTFYRKVKGLTGLSVNEFVRRIRIAKAWEYLKSGDYNVSETAYMTGFSDVSYFRKCFREQYNVNPSEIANK